MDNFFQNCPAKMEDGRHITDYQSSTRRDEYIKYMNNIYRDDQYRLFLQSNGKNIMNKEWAFNNKYNKCWDNACIHHYPTRSLPKHFMQERQAFDSIFNPQMNNQFAPLRVCNQYKGYRMFSDN